jgi:methylenetetrahydrofolate reductase (NADPH)
MLGEGLRRNNGFEVLNNGEREKIRNWLNGAEIEVIPTKSGTLKTETLLSMPIDNSIAVTSSPKESLEKFTINFSRMLIESGREGKVVPHIAARHLTSSEHLVKIMDDVQKLNVKKIFSIAGDNSEPSGPFSSSLDFLRGIQEKDISSEGIDIAGYPEGHPKIPTEILNQALLSKQKWAKETGTKMNIVTQICFGSESIINWVEKIRGLGVELPVVVGVPGRISIVKLADLAKDLGIGGFAEFFSKNFGYASDLAKAALANYEPNQLLIDLSKKTSDKHKVEGIRIFTMYNIVPSMDWLEGAKSSL